MWLNKIDKQATGSCIDKMFRGHSRQIKMSTRRSIKYCRLILIICKCGTEVTKALFLKHVDDSCPENHEPSPWTVDDFLKNNKKKIIENLDTRAARKLFPGQGSTDLDKWDVSLVCGLLLNVCKLPQRISQDIKLLQKTRNQLAHLENPDISDEKYETSFDRLTGIIDRCGKEINKPELLQEIDTYFARVGTLQMADVNMDEEKLLDGWYTIIETTLANAPADIYELKTKLEDILMKFEQRGLQTDITLLIKVKIGIIGDNSEAVEKALAEILKEGFTGSKDVQKNVNTICDDVRHLRTEVESQTRGSILFKLTSCSLTSLVFLVDYFSSTTIEKRLQGIAGALEKMVNESVELGVTIPLETQQHIIKTLEEQLYIGPECKREKAHGKIFNDPIHGQIELHPLCLRIVDTPQFQRLRHIKQLDTCYLVYPGASHNRFEHSIGTCHLAGKYLRALKERQPELDITSKDILCVEVAALCHDMGQGPYSHVFEQKFIPVVKADRKWKHQQAAEKLFDYMLRDESNTLPQDFRRLMPGFEERDIEFIKEMIGDPKDMNGDTWPYKGRYKKKCFLYEVIDNGENGIDVDKWDYLARDSLMLGMKTNFDHDRCIHSARVLMADGRRHICYRDKSAQDLYDMFYTRMTLHRRAYQHKTHNIIGTMIRDAMILAEETFRIPGKNGEGKRISETIDDMEAYTKLTDDILQEIMRSTDKNLKESRDKIRKIYRRELYKCITQTQVDVLKTGWIKKQAVQDNLFNKIKQKGIELELEQVIEIDVVSVDYGRKEEDPVSKVWFYRKGEENRAVRISKEQVSYVLPDTFAEQYIRVYSSVTDLQLFDAVEESFSEWCTENKIAQPKGRHSPFTSV